MARKEHEHRWDYKKNVCVGCGMKWTYYLLLPPPPRVFVVSPELYERYRKLFPEG